MSEDNSWGHTSELIQPNYNANTQPQQDYGETSVLVQPNYEYSAVAQQEYGDTSVLTQQDYNNYEFDSSESDTSVLIQPEVGDTSVLIQSPTENVQPAYNLTKQDIANHSKHPNELYNKLSYDSINMLFKIGLIIGIIGSLICILGVCLPNRYTYDASIVNSNDISIFSHSVNYFTSWIGLAIIIIAILLLVSCIFIKYEFGLTRFIGLCAICILNYLSISKTNIDSNITNYTTMGIGYYIIYFGSGILLLSTIIILIANLKEQQLKNQLAA